MIKSIATFVDDPAQSEPFLTMLAQRARQLSIDLSITLLAPAPLIAAELAPFGSLFLPEAQLRADASDAVARIQAIVGRADDTVRFSTIYGDVAWLARELRDTRDVVDQFVIGPASAWRIHWLRRRVIETLLMASGTPLLLLPNGHEIGPVRRATFGWLPSGEAVRAAHDLVAMADAGASIDVVTVGPRPGSDAGPDARCAMADHFARHGFTACCHWIDDGREEDRQLQDFALAANADLLAVGGFGHSRIREIILGGVTASLVADPKVPILMSR